MIVFSDCVKIFMEMMCAIQFMIRLKTRVNLGQSFCDC